MRLVAIIERIGLGRGVEDPVVPPEVTLNAGGEHTRAAKVACSFFEAGRDGLIVHPVR
jgi:hypothetical protein